MVGHAQPSHKDKLLLLIILSMSQHIVPSIQLLTLGGVQMVSTITSQQLLVLQPLTQYNFFLITRTKDKNWLWSVAHNSEQDAVILLLLVLLLHQQSPTLILPLVQLITLHSMFRLLLKMINVLGLPTVPQNHQFSLLPKLPFHQWQKVLMQPPPGQSIIWNIMEVNWPFKLHLLNCP